MKNLLKILWREQNGQDLTSPNTRCFWAYLP
jgi:hypothetical protein